MIKLDIKATIKGDNVNVKSTGRISGSYNEVLYEALDVLEQIDSIDSELLVEAFGMFIEEKMANEDDN